MRYIVYILYSKKLCKHYVGSAENFEKRFKEHNAGQSRFTRAGVPWELKLKKEVNDRSEALALEKKIKNRGASRYLSEDI